MAFRFKNFNEDLLVKAAKRYAKNKRRLNKVKRAIAAGRTDNLDTEERRKAYYKREIRLNNEEKIRRLKIQMTKDISPEDTQSIVKKINTLESNDDMDALSAEELKTLGQERHIGFTNDILSSEYFESGLIAAAGIGHIDIRDGLNSGSGFLIGQDLFLTNQHVFNDETIPKQSELNMNYEKNRVGQRITPADFKFDPDRFFLTAKMVSEDSELDFALVAVKPISRDGISLSEFTTHKLKKEQGKILEGQPVTIIHHPDGREKSVTIHNSNLLELKDRVKDDHVCLYNSDTEPGSSGAPVFNNRWEVIALHSQAVPKQSKIPGFILDKEGKRMKKEDMLTRPNDIWWEANQGIRISFISQAIKDAPLNGSQKDIRDALVKEWES